MKPYYQDESCTIYHGDCREILPLLEPRNVDLVLSDPPYGTKTNTDYTRFSGGQRNDPRWRKGKTWEGIEGDGNAFDPSPWLEFQKVILWGANNFSHKLPPGSWLVWAKKEQGNFGNFLSDCEVAWSKGGCGVFLFHHVWDGFIRQTERGTSLHPSQKPVALMEWCLRRNPSSGVILDPYMGSGSVLRAAKNLGKKAIGIEQKEGYCAVAASRLAQEVLPLETG